MQLALVEEAMSIKRGALFLVVGVGLGVVTALASIGASVVLVRDASAAEPPRASVVFPAAPPLSPLEQQVDPLLHIELDDDPAAATPARTRRKSRAQEALLRRATAETAITLAALVAADNRARAVKQ